MRPAATQPSGITEEGGCRNGLEAGRTRSGSSGASMNLPELFINEHIIWFACTSMCLCLCYQPVCVRAAGLCVHRLQQEHPSARRCWISKTVADQYIAGTSKTHLGWRRRYKSAISRWTQPLMSSLDTVHIHTLTQKHNEKVPDLRYSHLQCMQTFKIIIHTFFSYFCVSVLRLIIHLL